MRWWAVLRAWWSRQGRATRWVLAIVLGLAAYLALFFGFVAVMEVAVRSGLVSCCSNW